MPAKKPAKSLETVLDELVAAAEYRRGCMTEAELSTSADATVELIEADREFLRIRAQLLTRLEKLGVLER